MPSENMRKQVFLIILMMLIPGCITDDELIPVTNIADNPYESIHQSSNVTFNISIGTDLENAIDNFSITINLDHIAAPAHADNLLAHVVAGNYDMSKFHRVIDDFMVQGGDFENGDGTGGYAADWFGVCNGVINVSLDDCPNQEDWNVPDEANNGLEHLPCTISMAKTSLPNTGGSQFFLMPDDITQHSWLDGVHTVFGVITHGCEHVTKISEVSTGNYDRPITPVMIRNATLGVFIETPVESEETNEEVAEQDISYNYSNVTFEIYHGDSLENSTANYSITMMLNHTAAPLHADNFRKHVIAGNFDMNIFHRIIDDFMIQGGDFENNNGSGGYAADWYGICDGDSNVNQSNCPQQEWNVPDEADNGLQHFSCTLSMAKTSNPNSAGSQFFLIPGDITHHTWLDGQYTVFGEVTSGCEHVTEISQVETDENDKPLVSVVIQSAIASD